MFVHLPTFVPTAVCACAIAASGFAQRAPHAATPGVAAAADLSDGAAAQRMSFEQALQTMRSHDDTLAAAQAEIERVRAERAMMIGRFLPDVDLTARVTHLDAPIALTLQPVKGEITNGLQSLPIPIPIPDEKLDGLLSSFRYPLQRQTFFNVTLKATTPFFTGGRLLAGMRAATLAVEAATYAQRQTLAQSTTTLVERYYGARMADEALKVRKATVQSLQKHVQNAQHLEHEGQISHAELLRAQVALAQAQMKYDNAQRQRDLAHAGLRTLLRTDTDVIPTSPFFEVQATSSLEDLQAQALQNNPQYQAANIGQKRAHEAVRATRGEFSPTIGGFALVEVYRGDLTPMEPNWAIGVQLQWNLFQGGQRFYKLKAAKAREAKIAAKITEAGQNIPLLVQKRYQAYEQALAQLAQYQKTQDLAQESVDAQRHAFEAGLATSLDVVDAQLSLSRVKLGILNARYESNLAWAKLLEAIGRSNNLLTSTHTIAPTQHSEAHP